MERQRNRNHMREQNRDPGIMQSSNLADAEFKTPVIKMLNELRGRVDELSKSLPKEIEITKKNQSEIKNTIAEIKNTLDRINS